jgi:hypothetical protein
VALVEKGEIFSMSVSKRKYEEMLEEQSDKELLKEQCLLPQLNPQY